MRRHAMRTSSKRVFDADGETGLSSTISTDKNCGSAGLEGLYSLLPVDLGLRNRMASAQNSLFIQ